MSYDLNLGCGRTRFDGFINLDIARNTMTDLDIQGNVLRLPFKNESFKRIGLFHVLEHIERIYHVKLFDEIWRILKPKGSVIVCCPEILEVMKRFMDNTYGQRWSWYNLMLYGRQLYKSDYHVTATERRDVVDKLFNCGFKDVNCTLEGTDLTVKARKGEKLSDYI